MHKVGAVYFNNKKAGILEELPGPLFRFTYDKEYLQQKDVMPISFSLPLQHAPFEGDQLFPFFAGMLTEGWLKKIQVQSQKIDQNNLMQRLLANGSELLGAIRIEEIK